MSKKFVVKNVENEKEVQSIETITKKENMKKYHPFFLFLYCFSTPMFTSFNSLLSL